MKEIQYLLIGSRKFLECVIFTRFETGKLDENFFENNLQLSEKKISLTGKRLIGNKLLRITASKNDLCKENLFWTLVFQNKNFEGHVSILICIRMH